MSRGFVQPIRGTHDLMPQAYRAHRHIVETARHTAHQFGFQSMATPLIEPLETFQKPLGETSDIVGKEMYMFQDRSGGTPIVLRPEGTAGVVRAVLHQRMHQNGPLRLFYEGPMFRYDRPQKGRQRQFHHVGVEFLGDPSYLADFEVLTLSFHVLTALGLGDRVVLELNSLGDAEARQRYRHQLTTYLKDHTAHLSEENQIRLNQNPLRILDAKALSEQEETLLAHAPSLKESLSSESLNRFEALKALLKHHQIPYRESPYLVRGLDYYDHTVFEWTTNELGAQAAVLAGGCYHGLVQTMGGPETAGVGWAAGVERLALMMPAHTIPEPRPILYLLPLSPSEWSYGAYVAHELREQGACVELWGQGPLSKRLKQVQKRQGRWALVMGEDEIQDDAVMVRDLVKGTQEPVGRPNLVFYMAHLKVFGEEP